MKMNEELIKELKNKLSQRKLHEQLNDDSYFGKIKQKVVSAIDVIIVKHPYFSIKRIRQYLKIESSNKSMIMMIYRALNELHQKGKLNLLQKKSPKIYTKKSG